MRQTTQTETVRCLPPLNLKLSQIGTKNTRCVRQGRSQNRLLSGARGDVTEFEGLLRAMREARDDHEAKKTAEKDACLDAERKKEAAGDALVRRSLKRRGKKEWQSQDGGDSDDATPMPQKKRRTFTSPGRQHQGELEAFGETLRDSDAQRMDLGRYWLEFEKLMYAQDVKDGEADRI